MAAVCGHPGSRLAAIASSISSSTESPLSTPTTPPSVHVRLFRVLAWVRVRRCDERFDAARRRDLLRDPTPLTERVPALTQAQRSPQTPSIWKICGCVCLVALAHLCYLESYLREAIWIAILLKFGHVDSSSYQELSWGAIMIAQIWTQLSCSYRASDSYVIASDS